MDPKRKFNNIKCVTHCKIDPLLKKQYSEAFIWMGKENVQTDNAVGHLQHMLIFCVFDSAVMLHFIWLYRCKYNLNNNKKSLIHPKEQFKESVSCCIEITPPVLLEKTTEMSIAEWTLVTRHPCSRKSRGIQAY